jgi:hypothetical protein
MYAKSDDSDLNASSSIRIDSDNEWVMDRDEFSNFSDAVVDRSSRMDVDIRVVRICSSHIPSRRRRKSFISFSRSYHLCRSWWASGEVVAMMIITIVRYH